MPVHFVQLAWQAIKFAVLQLPCIQIQEFIRYFEDTWLVGNYPLIMWNVYRSDGFRTNNHLEGCHNRLKRLVEKAHPNIYKFVEAIRKEHTVTESVFVLQLEAGARPPRRALKAIKIEKYKNLRML